MAEPCFQHEVRGGSKFNAQLCAAPHPNPLPIMPEACLRHDVKNDGEKEPRCMHIALAVNFSDTLWVTC